MAWLGIGASTTASAAPAAGTVAGSAIPTAAINTGGALGGSLAGAASPLSIGGAGSLTTGGVGGNAIGALGNVGGQLGQVAGGAGQGLFQGANYGGWMQQAGNAAANPVAGGFNWGNILSGTLGAKSGSDVSNSNAKRIKAATNAINEKGLPHLAPQVKQGEAVVTSGVNYTGKGAAGQTAKSLSDGAKAINQSKVQPAFNPFTAPQMTPAGGIGQQILNTEVAKNPGILNQLQGGYDKLQGLLKDYPRTVEMGKFVGNQLMSAPGGQAAPAVGAPNAQFNQGQQRGQSAEDQMNQFLMSLFQGRQ